MIKLFAINLTALIITGCSMPKEIEQNVQIAEQVKQTENLISHHYIANSNSQNSSSYKIHYVSSDESNSARPTVVFVHGTPGSWESFARYFLDIPLLERFRLISVDRPGWGESSYPDKNFPTDLAQQTELLGPTLKQIWSENDQQKVILVGHSLGGSLVPILASAYPEYVRGVLILAGDVSPELAHYRWYNSLLSWVPKSWIADEWYYSNEEVLELSNSLQKAQSQLSQIKIPITVLQGTADTLVDPQNAEFAKTLFKQSELKVEWIPDAGHIINLQHTDLVHQAIESLYDRS